MSVPMEGIFDGSIEWRPIPGWEDAYLVSSDGRIWSMRSKKELSLKLQKTGYLRVGLSVDGRRCDYGVHRLVALAFIPNPNEKPTVNHKNEIKADNRVQNLEWATSAEQNVYGTRISRVVANTDWAARTAKMDYFAIAGKHDYNNLNAAQRRKVVQKDFAGKLIKTHDGIGMAARSVDASAGHIWECCQGRRKSCKGSVWEYA